MALSLANARAVAMDKLLRDGCELLMHHWQNATLFQYLCLVVVIVSLGWLISRVTSR